jgi:hypothetical protein
MKTLTIRLALVSACLAAGCHAFPTNGPTPGTAEVSMAPTDPAVLATLSGMKGEKPDYPPVYQDCCKVTGGGFILKKGYGYGKDKGDLRINYGFNAQFGPDGLPKGHVNVVVHVDGPGNVHFQSGTVDSVVCKLDPGSQHPRLTGTVTVTGQLKGGGTYELKVTDNGEPGVNDVFRFSTSTGFSVSDTVDGGNIQIHRDKCD